MSGWAVPGQVAQGPSRSVRSIDSPRLSTPHPTLSPKPHPSLSLAARPARLARPAATTPAPAPRVAAYHTTPSAPPVTAFAPRPAASRAVRVAATCGDIDPDNASVLVCGGGGVALEVARRLKDAGAWVWMLQRSDIRR